ncbi:MAG: hypothetical protein RL596_2421 [Bacteroidota bacterium]|jgi:tRNA U34 5-methylaminomethyl-2-thiouridine-forming methyltransferase MnmC
MQRIIEVTTDRSHNFDAFAPTAQPELWTIEVFNYLFSLLVKMEAAGLTIHKISEPPGKREMVRGIK